MQATGDLHDQIIKAFPHVAEDIVDNPKDFHAAERVFNQDAVFGNEAVRGFFFQREVAAFGLLDRL